MKFRKGFTMIETMVVLVISALLLSLSLFVYRGLSVNRYQNRFFWREFKSDFELYENLAKVRHTGVNIIFSPSSKQITFLGLNSKIYRKVIKEPKDLSTKRSYRVTITNDGYVNPSRVVWLVNGRPRLNQNFQLGWGVYNFEKIK